MTRELTTRPLAEVADLIAAREVSSREVTEACLAAVADWQPVINAFIRVDGDKARAQADAADAALARGEAAGPLHGVPLAHKDMYYRAGEVCTCGSKIRAEWVPEFTATVLERLDAAGAVTVGTLNMAEFASGGTGHNVHWGHCRNPWHPDHITGGSSSGSGAATAAGLVYGSLGSDTGGSIRMPAAFCGVVGMKGTQGRVSRYGAMGLSFSLDNVGPLARTVRDCARMMQVVAGPDPLDETSLDVPVDDYEGGLTAPIAGLRIGIPANYYHDDLDPAIGDALEATRRVFERLGCRLVEVDIPHHDALSSLQPAISLPEQVTLHEHWLRTRPDDYSKLVRARMMAGFAISASEYLKAQQLRPRLTRSFVEQVYGACDLLHLPMLRFPLPTIEETDVGDAPELLEVMARITHCTRPINFLGLPSLAMPTGRFDAGGLPIAFQLVGRPFAEALAFRAGYAFEAATACTEPRPTPAPAAMAAN
jgi:aspartyl-tRNA(Asn)/glutamyl-tRNA(Gln) amidotransferase subunit A